MEEDNNDFTFLTINKYGNHNFNIVDNEKLQRPYDTNSVKNKPLNLYNFLPKEHNRYIIKETYKLHSDEDPNCVCGQGLCKGDKINKQNLVYDKQRQIGFILGSCCIENFFKTEICKICQICGIKNFQDIDGKVKINKFKEEQNICIKCYNKKKKECLKDTTRALLSNELSLMQNEFLHNRKKDYIVSFGKHKGKKYKEVPYDYMEWICNTNIKCNLNFYLYCKKECNK